LAASADYTRQASIFITRRNSVSTTIAAKVTVFRVAGSKKECDIRIGGQSFGTCFMTPSDSHEQAAKESDLDGLCVLIVEDSWHVGRGLKMLLESCGAQVMGPVATVAEAERLTAMRSPDVAIVDVNLRRGERSHGLIDRLHGQGIRVVVMTGYANTSLPFGKATTILQKPMREDLLLASLRREKAQRNGEE
jgi:ActR/RegA family two-component response regulator